MTGLSHAHGENVFLIDSDLEEEPEWLLSFSEQMERDRCDVVYGVQEQRKGRTVRALEWAMVLSIFSGAHRVGPAGKHCHRPVDDTSLC